MSSSASKRGSYSQSYSKEGISAALHEYNQQQRSDRKPSFAKIGQRYSIPESTLRDYHVRSLSAIASSAPYAAPNEVMESLISSTRSGGTNKLLDDDTEQKLKTWIDACGEHLEPPTVDLIRIKAKRLYFATHNIPISSSNEHHMASLGWWRGYKSRFPTLSVRSIQPHSFARARATQPEIINHFYDLLTVVLSVRGHVSIMHICNANGVSLPPLYVFSGCQLVHNMLDGAPPGTIHTYKNTKKSCYFC